MKRQEIEQKFRLRNPAAMRKNILKLGATRIRFGTQRNEYFDKNGRLKSKKMILRLRRDVLGSILTLKGPRQQSRFSRRMEYQTDVDYSQTKAILRELGYSVWRHYAKEREEFRLGSAVITLDYLGRRGWFMEIEDTSKGILRLSKKLGLTEHDREERTYLGILSSPQSAAKRKRNKPFRF
jgi:predicted adenylyl cyclase CyaB